MIGIAHARRGRCHLAITVAVLAALAGPTAFAGTDDCGNLLLDPSETCASCPADCRPATCAPAGTRRLAIDLTAPRGVTVSAVTLQLAYRTDRLTIPGEGMAQPVAQRVTPLADVQSLSSNDLGYALRLALVRGQGLADGALVEIAFDGCAGAAAPSAPDLRCTVEGCAGGAGPVNGCTCAVRVL